jgi:hypothetical protein
MKFGAHYSQEDYTLKLKESLTTKIILQTQLKPDFVGYLLLLQIFQLYGNLFGAPQPIKLD